jgi:hypothetical protein
MLFPLLNTKPQEPAPFSSAPKPAFTKFLKDWAAKMAEGAANTSAKFDSALSENCVAGDVAEPTSPLPQNVLSQKAGARELADAEVHHSTAALLRKKQPGGPDARKSHNANLLGTAAGIQMSVPESARKNTNLIPNRRPKTETTERGTNFRDDRTDVAPPVALQPGDRPQPCSLNTYSSLLMNTSGVTSEGGILGRAGEVAARFEPNDQERQRLLADRTVGGDSEAVPAPSDRPSSLPSASGVQSGELSWPFGPPTAEGIQSSADVEVPTASQGFMPPPNQAMDAGDFVNQRANPTSAQTDEALSGISPMTFPPVSGRSAEGRLPELLNGSVLRAVVSQPRHSLAKASTENPVERPKLSVLEVDTIPSESSGSVPAFEDRAAGVSRTNPPQLVNFGSDKHRREVNAEFAAQSVRSSTEPDSQVESVDELPSAPVTAQQLRDAQPDANEFSQSPTPALSLLQRTTSQPGISSPSAHPRGDSGNKVESGHSSTSQPREDAQDAAPTLNDDPAPQPAHTAAREAPSSFPANKSSAAVLPPHAAAALTATSESRPAIAPQGNHPENVAQQRAVSLDIESGLAKIHPQEIPAQELHLNLRTAELGRVEIRTSLKDDHITAHVAVDNSAAQKALNAELSGLRGALAAADLKVDNLSVASSADPHSGGSQMGSGSSQEHGPTRHFPAGTVKRVAEAERDESSEQCSINIVV